MRGSHRRRRVDDNVDVHVLSPVLHWLHVVVRVGMGMVMGGTVRINWMMVRVRGLMWRMLLRLFCLLLDKSLKRRKRKEGEEGSRKKKKEEERRKREREKKR